jgi:hypothetical protein
MVNPKAVEPFSVSEKAIGTHQPKEATMEKASDESHFHVVEMQRRSVR